MSVFKKRLTALGLVLFLSFSVSLAHAKRAAGRKSSGSGVTAKAYVIVDAETGRILYGKNPDLKLPPASTTKVMTVLIARQELSMKKTIVIGRLAADVPPSKAGLTPGAAYKVEDLIKAALVSSSNDAAVALAEAVAGSEREFANRMNLKARQLGMNDTFFVNATGLTDKRRKQYTTAYDLTKLMRAAVKDKTLDDLMEIIETTISGSDGKMIPLRAHNKMLWKTPKFIKGKTGYTNASLHTFVGTDYSSNKSITFAILSSQKPWTDIERVVKIGLSHL